MCLLVSVRASCQGSHQRKNGDIVCRQPGLTQHIIALYNDTAAGRVSGSLCVCVCVCVCVCSFSLLLLLIILTDTHRRRSGRGLCLWLQLYSLGTTVTLVTCGDVCPIVVLLLLACPHFVEVAFKFFNSVGYYHPLWQIVMPYY